MDYSIIGADDREYGPVSKQTLVEWARDGRVVPRTAVLEHATGRRFLACDIPELSTVFDGSMAIAPPVQGRPYYPAVPPTAYPPAIYVAPQRNRFVAGALGIFLGMFGA